MRTCAGCRNVRAQAELIRLVVEHRRVTLDPGRRLPGRGAYLCADTPLRCLGLARRRRSLARSLRVGDDVIDYVTLGEALARGSLEVPR